MNDTENHRLPRSAPEMPAFQMGPWRVDPALNRINDGGRDVVVEPRMMHVLVCLAAVPGEVVTRSDLLDVVWHDAIVGEEALTRSLSRLRGLLGEDNTHPEYFETIRGRGYRLLANVEPATKLHMAKRRRSSWKPIIAMAVIFAVLAIVWFSTRRVSDPSPSLATALPVTTFPGNEFHPTLAPDDKTIVFAWSGNDDQPPGLFLKQLDKEQPRRLTTSEYRDQHPAVSPDGTTVAFHRRDKDGHSILTVSALGGATRLLTKTTSIVVGLTWSPDGDRVVFAASTEAINQFCIQQIDVKTLELSSLTTVDTSIHTGDSWPRFSPDGKHLAYARCDHAGLRNLWIAPAAGGPGRAVTTGLNHVDGLAWLTDNRTVLVSADPDGRQGLWRVDIADGAQTPQPITATDRTLHPAISRDGTTLAFTNRTANYDFQLIDLDNPGDPGFALSTRNEKFGAISPDGRQVAFSSERSGFPEVWLAKSDGEDLRKLTSRQGPEIGQIFWSPDNRRIAVNMISDDRHWVEILDTATGAPTSLTRPEHQRCCGWTVDLNTISLLRDQESAWRLCRLQIETGEETACALLLPGHPQIIEAQDGFYYLPTDKDGMWHSPPNGDMGRQILGADAMKGWLCWDVSRAGLHVIRRTEDGVLLLARVDMSSGAHTSLMEISGRPRDLEMADDGRRALITILESIKSDLMMIPLR
jgi:Tol biopolymer transport system component/DNA-binding winged helix-turn-helix (wHTH) protein